MLALSLAVSSCSNISKSLSMSKSSVDTFRLTIRLMSGGSFVNNTDDSIAPNDSVSTLSALRLLVLASD